MKRMTRRGFLAIAAAAHFAALTKRECDRWGGIVAATGFTPQD